jgi:hypothetical protein
MFRGTDTQQRPGEPVGVSLALDRSAQNADGDTCRIVWSFLDANGPTPVSDSLLVNRDAKDVDGDRAACSGAARIWVPFTPSLLNYDRLIVRVELFDGKARLGLPVYSPVIPMG